MDNLMNPHEDKWGIIELQNCILNIAKYIDDFCDSHGIDYCLMGGSALGAVRHKGFIPWDDDLDVFMRPDEYDKFRECFLKNGDKSRFYLQEWGSKKGHPTIAKLRLNNSHYVEPDFEQLNIHKGVFVDIFILHSCPNSKIGHWHQYFWSRYLVLKSLANRNYSRRGLLGSLVLKPLKWLPKRAFVEFAIKQLYHQHNRLTNNFCHYLGRAGYSKGLYKSDYFLKTKKVAFEMIRLRVPYKVEDYLADRWGNYMQIPSDEEIKYYQHSSGWSVDKPFEGYNTENIYPDETDLIT